MNTFYDVAITQNFFNIHIYTFIQTNILGLLYCLIVRFIVLSIVFIGFILTLFFYRINLINRLFCSPYPTNNLNFVNFMLKLVNKFVFLNIVSVYLTHQNETNKLTYLQIIKFYHYEFNCKKFRNYKSIKRHF